MLPLTTGEPLSGPSPHEDRGAAIHIDRLYKQFTTRRGWRDLARRSPAGKTIAVDRVSLVVHSGEIVGLLGTNGAGKTTLVKMLSTLILPDAGEASVYGYDVVADAARVRALLCTVAADERSLEWRLTARENLMLFAALYGLRRIERDATITEVLDAVGLVDTGSKLVGAFSSGMKQRLLVGRALLARPRVLLLDEPTRSLDPLAARGFRHFLRTEIAEKRECTVILATHDADEALELCDRIAILERGRLLEVDSPHDLMHKFGGDRFRAWTATPDHPVFGACSARRVEGQAGADPEGRAVVEFEITPEPNASSELLKRLVDGGADVARFERVKPSLADLIERVVKSRSSDFVA
jgi:ABC-2 type transport system ATP-binding protein